MKFIIKYIITALFVIISFGLNAQTVQYFNKVFSIVENDSIGAVFSAAISSDSIYIVTGREIDDNGLKVYAYAFDESSSLINRFLLDSTEHLRTIYSESFLIKNSDKQYIYIYSYALDTLENGWLNYDIRLVKFTEEGEILWFKSYGGSDGEDPTQIIETSDGGYLITGFSRDEIADDWFRYYFLKLDKDGNEEWQRNFGYPHWHAKTTSTVETKSGHFLSGGWVILEGLIQEKMFVKLDQEGNLIWQRIFGNEYHDCGSTLVELNDSVIWQFSCLRDTTYRSYMALINEDLEIIKDTAYFLPYDEFFGVQSLPVILDDGSAVSSGTFINEYGNWQPYLIKFNTNLGIEWLHSFSLKDEEDCVLNSIDKTSDGGFILAGMQWTGDQDGWLLKVDSLGNTCSYLDCDSIATTPLTENDILETIDLEAQFPDTISNSDPITKIVRDSIDVPNGILSNSDKHYLNLYPNPTKNRLSISYHLPPYAGDQALLVFYNTEGKMVRIENLATYSNEYLINLHHWAKGIYLYKVHLFDEVLFEGKLVVE